MPYLRFYYFQHYNVIRHVTRNSYGCLPLVFLGHKTPWVFYEKNVLSSRGVYQGTSMPGLKMLEMNQLNAIIIVK